MLRSLQQARAILVLCVLVTATQFFSANRLIDNHREKYEGRHSMYSLQVTTQTSKFRTVDILSIGSNRRLEYLQAQQDTFARHLSVRYFFNATEDSDADPSCSQRLSKWNVTQISRFCHVEMEPDSSISHGLLEDSIR